MAAALTDGNRSVRLSAAMALGEIGPDAAPALSSLLRLVTAEDSEAQASVVCSMVSICEKSAPAAQMLRELLEATGEPVRGSAATALRRVTGLD